MQQEQFVVKKQSFASNVVTESSRHSPRTTESSKRKVSQIFEDEFRQRIDSVLHENHQQLNLASQLIKQLEQIKEFQVDRNEEILRALKYYKNFHTHSPEHCHSGEKKSISPKSKIQLQKGEQPKGDPKEIFEKLSLYKTVELRYFIEEFQEQEKQQAYKKLHDKGVLPDQIKHYNPAYLQSINNYSKQQAQVLKQYVSQVLEQNIEKIQFRKPAIKNSSKFYDSNIQQIDQSCKEQEKQINEIKSQLMDIIQELSHISVNYEEVKEQHKNTKQEFQQQFQQVQETILALGESLAQKVEPAQRESAIKSSQQSSRQSISNLSEKQIKRTQKQKQTDLVEKHAMLNYFRQEFASSFEEVNQNFLQILQENRNVVEKQLDQMKNEFKDMIQTITYSQMLQNVSSSIEPSNMQLVGERTQEIVDNTSVSADKGQYDHQQKEQKETDPQPENLSLNQDVEVLKKQNDVLIIQSNKIKEDIARLFQWIKELQYFNSIHQTQFEKRLSEVYSQHEMISQEQQQSKQILVNLKNSMKVDTIQNLDNSFRSDLDLKEHEHNLVTILKGVELKVAELVQKVDFLDQKCQTSLIRKNQDNQPTHDILQQLYLLQNCQNKVIVNQKQDIGQLVNPQLKIQNLKFYINLYDNSIYSVLGYQYLLIQLMSEYDSFQGFIDEIKLLTMIVYADQVQISQSQLSEMKQLFILYLIQVYNEDFSNRLQAFNILYNNEQNLNFHILANIYIRNLLHSMKESDMALLNWNTQPNLIDYQLVAQHLRIKLQYIQVEENEVKQNSYGEGCRITILEVDKKYYIGIVD